MKQLTVKPGSHSYPVYIGRGLLGQLDEYVVPRLPGSRAVVVSDTNVAPLYLDRVLAALSGCEADAVTIAAGEESKTLATFQHVCTELLKRGAGRDLAVVALGGGVVGDLAGFVAASYQRGVAFVQLPTTLLAQVDSAVGGKTGVNHPLGKNMIGAFHQPCCVAADLDALDTLPQQHLSAGLAEVIKYGLLMDRAFFEWLEQNLPALTARDDAALACAIHRSCEIKATIVSADELERSGRRTLLNLGHTFGHAIETGLGHGRWLHGEAVGCGLVLAARLSARLGLIREDDVRRVTAAVKLAGLPVEKPASLDADRLLELMALDKKNIAGRRRFVLLKNIGEAFVSDDVELGEVKAVLE